ncbi:hypothetical protein FOZ63_003513, partial [Perkinsus olseni]
CSLTPPPPPFPGFTARGVVKLKPPAVLSAIDISKTFEDLERAVPGTVAPLPQYFRDAADIQVPKTQQTTTTAEPLVDLSSVDISKSMGDFEDSLFQQPSSDTSAPSSAEATKPDNKAGDMKDSPWLPAIFAVAVVNLLLTAAGVLMMMRRTTPQGKTEPAPSSAEAVKPDNLASHMEDSPWLPMIAILNLLLTAAGVIMMMRRRAPRGKA